MSIRIKSAVATALMAIVGTVGAQTSEPSIDASLEAVSGDAELVFQGTVTNITYAASVEGIPHTFVTYKVEDVLKGSYSAPTLTLRFIGGVKVEGNVMRRLSVSHAPKFEAGQQDLLMVKDNTRTQCPLVQCSRGRFRFEQGFVTTESGEVLARGSQNRMLALPPSVQEQAPGDIGARDSAVQAIPAAAPLDRVSFVAHVRQVVGRQAAPLPKQILSADPAQAFKGPDPAVSGPPRQSLRAQSAAAPQSERDRQELEALARNGGNPVLSAKDVESLKRLGTTAAR